MSLRELTKEHHQNAERQEFVTILMSGNIDPEIYAIFLANQWPMYDILEASALGAGLLDGLLDIRRTYAIWQDWRELWTKEELPPRLEVTEKYTAHIMDIKDDETKLFAHIYTRHMGDLSGGRMIAKKVPGEKRLYTFKDPDTLKTKIRERLTDDMADEAKICFDFATDTFREMMALAKAPNYSIFKRIGDPF
mgnify:CR=1 FL=1